MILDEYPTVVAYNPEEKIKLKAFHCEIQNDHEGLKKEIADYVELPVIRVVNPGLIHRNYLQVKQDVQELIETVFEKLLEDPAKAYLVIKKTNKQ